jgi:hypothetical protein
MPYDLTKLAAISVVVATLGAAPAMAQDQEFAGWDQDGNGILSEQEFTSGFNGGETYSEWDANNDSSLTEDEWTSGFGEGDADVSGFGQWDANGDGSLSQEEFTSGAFAHYDTDSSGDWNEVEYAGFEADREEGIW